MYNKQTGGKNRSFCRLSMGLCVCCTLMAGVLLFRINAYANADEFAIVYLGETVGANVDADSGQLAVQNRGESEVVEANDKDSKPVDIDPASSVVVQLDASQGDQHSLADLAGSQDMRSLDVVDTGAAVKFTHTADDIAGGIGDQSADVELGDQPKESKPVNIDPAASDVVQLDANPEDQNSRLDLAGSGEMQSLDIVDTGASVEFTHTAADIAGGVDAQQANVERRAQPMSGLNEDMIERHDEQLLVADGGSNLPVTSTEYARNQNQIGDGGSPLNDISNDVTNEENVGLPYAVVLALLALIGLVPVARRNDHHHHV